MSADQYRALVGVANQPPMHAANGRPVRKQQARLSTSLTVHGGKPLPRQFTCELPFLPPTTNNLFTTLKSGHRVKTGKYRRFIRNCEKLIHGRLDPTARYTLIITVQTSLFSKAGKLRRLDASNRIKALEDVLASRLGIDDRQFFDVMVRKRDGEEKTVVVIAELPPVVGAESR